MTLSARRTLTVARAVLEEKKNVEYRKQIIESQDPLQRPDGLGVTGRIPDDFEHATGLERKELLEIAKGNEVRWSRCWRWRYADQKDGRRQLDAWRVSMCMCGCVCARE
jgi:cytochrome c oxidase subunit 5b